MPRILIVDDSPETRFVYRRYLDRSNMVCELREADTVRSAQEMLRSHPADCVLLDYCLPDGNGLEFLSALSGQPSTPAVVMITGQGDEAVAVDAMKQGVKDYLIKDRITMESLIAAIEAAMGEAQRDREELDYREELEKQSVTDALTGLFNRRYFFEQLRKEMKRSARYGHELSLLLIDLDHFKSINDRYGHIAGDHVLRSFSSLLADNLRAGDHLARYGGEEFCIALSETGRDGARQFANRLLAQCRELVHRDPDGGEFTVTCSIGLVQFSSGITEVEALVHSADKALYEAKRNGRDCVMIGDASAEIRACG